MPTITIPEKLNIRIKSFFVQMINEILSDPDFGLELSAEAQKRLRRDLVSKKTIPFSEIKKKYY